MGWSCSAHGEIGNAYNILVGRPEVKRTLERPRHKWNNNIKITIKEIVWIGLVWTRIGISGQFHVNTLMNLQVP